ncbi:Calcium-binding protein 39 [Lemmus lemmus]
MRFPFGKSHKSPTVIVKNLKESLAVLEKQDILTKKKKKKKKKKKSKQKRLPKNASKMLVALKEILSQLAPELFNTGLLSTLVANPWLLGFEGKKDVAQIFNNILRRQIGARTPAVEYICTQQNIFFMLLKGSESPEITFSCGTMLRECIRHEPLAKIILWSEQFFGFFRYVEVSIFDIVSEAFATLKDLLTRHKLLSTDFWNSIMTDFSVNMRSYFIQKVMWQRDGHCSFSVNCC